MKKIDEKEIISNLLDRLQHAQVMSDEDIASTIRGILYNVDKLMEYKWMYEELCDE